MAGRHQGGDRGAAVAGARRDGGSGGAFLTLSSLRTRPSAWVATAALLAWAQMLLCFEGVLRDEAKEQGGLVHDPFFAAMTLCAGAALLALCALGRRRGGARHGGAPGLAGAPAPAGRAPLVAACALGALAAGCATLLATTHPQVSPGVSGAAGALGGVACAALTLRWGISLSRLDLREVLVLVTFGACLQWVPLAFAQWMPAAVKVAFACGLPALFCWATLRLDAGEADGAGGAGGEGYGAPAGAQGAPEPARASGAGTPATAGTAGRAGGRARQGGGTAAVRLGAAMLVFSMVVQFVWGFFVKMGPSRLDVGLFGALFGLVALASAAVGGFCVAAMNRRHCYRLELLYRAMYLFCAVGSTAIGIAGASAVGSAQLLGAYLLVYVGYSLLCPTMLLLALGCVHMRRQSPREVVALVMGAHYLGLFVGSTVLDAFAAGRAQGAGAGLVPYAVTVAVALLAVAYVAVFPERDLLSLSPLLFGMSHESVDLRCRELADEAGLTPRETDVLTLLARGRDVVFIAGKLGIARNTVNVHRRSIYAKLGIHSQQELLTMVERASDGQAAEAPRG